MLINRVVRFACVGVLAATALSACGSDGPDAYTASESDADITSPDASDSDPTGGESPDGAAPEAESPSSGVPATGETFEVKALDNTFIEESVDVVAGTEVVWKNGGRNDHDIVPAAEGESWGVGIEGFRPGDSYSHVFTEPGEYAYYCTIHGTADVGMTGTIIVN